jgi:hypothetical protein
VALAVREAVRRGAEEVDVPRRAETITELRRAAVAVSREACDPAERRDRQRAVLVGDPRVSLAVVDGEGERGAVVVVGASGRSGVIEFVADKRERQGLTNRV